MRRALAVCAVLLSLPLVGRAAEPTETVIRLNVRPAPAPKPALKYQLLPELAEMNPGNPIQGYAKCFAEQYPFWRNKEEVEKRENWQTMPLAELPLKQMGYYNRRGPLGYADWAARLDTPDWQILLQLKRDGPVLLLPDIQGLRELARALKVRFRIEVAQRRFDDALYTASTMFALSRHLGEHPTLIGELVGIAVGSLTLGPLDEMIAQPGCPNLYWALTDLPQPFIDLRKGAQGERAMLREVFAPIDARTAMSDAQLRAAVDRIDHAWKSLNVKKDVPVWLNTLAGDEEHVRSARRRLIDAAIAEDRVKQFPAAQVILLDEKLGVEVRRDEELKAMALPFWHAEPMLRARREALREAREDALFLGIGGTGGRAKAAQARLDQRLGLLRCVEALRLYAAGHVGELPAKLADVGVPLPVDAVTGQPFVYEHKDGTAILHGKPPRGMEKNATFNVRYEVTIGK